MIITPEQCLDILTHARSLIATPEHWIRDVFARTARGKVCRTPGDNTAAMFCARGAIHNVMLRHFFADRWDRNMDYDLCKEIVKANKMEVIINSMETVAIFNNDLKTTHKDILDIFDKAIEALTPQSEESKTEKVLELV